MSLVSFLWEQGCVLTLKGEGLAFMAPDHYYKEGVRIVRARKKQLIKELEEGDGTFFPHGCKSWQCVYCSAGSVKDWDRITMKMKSRFRLECSYNRVFRDMMKLEVCPRYGIQFLDG